MPIVNPRFREPGERPGVPRGWSLRSSVRDERLVGFGPAPERAVEDFERWYPLTRVLPLVEQVFFDTRPEGFEDFSEGWQTDTFAFALRDAPIEQAQFGRDLAESLEHGWSNDSYLTAWSSVPSSHALFAGSPAEGFEGGHRNDGYAWKWTRVRSTVAIFGERTVEIFEASWPEHDDRGDVHHD